MVRLIRLSEKSFENLVIFRNKLYETKKIYVRSLTKFANFILENINENEVMELWNRVSEEKEQK